MTLRRGRRRVQLYTLRLWREEAQEENAWRGQVRMAQTGEVRNFRGWAGLVKCLEEMLAEREPAG